MFCPLELLVVYFSRDLVHFLAHSRLFMDKSGHMPPEYLMAEMYWNKKQTNKQTKKNTYKHTDHLWGKFSNAPYYFLYVILTHET